MVAIDQYPSIRNTVNRTMLEPQFGQFPPEKLHCRAMGHLPQSKKNPGIRPTGNICLQKFPASSDFVGCRLVLRRHTAHRIDDHHAFQLQAIIRTGTISAFRQTKLVQYPIKKLTSTIPGKRSARTIGSLQSGRQANNHKTRIRVTKGPDRCIMPCRVFLAQFSSPGSETWTERTIDRRLIGNTHAAS